MSIIRKIVFALMAFSSLPTCAQGDSLSRDSSVAKEDSATVVKNKEKKNIFSFIGDIVRSFSDYDEEYIEPQHYNYALMLQNTNTYEVYRISNKEGQSVKFAPDPTFRIGPYFGWRWIFLGYTVDVTHLGGGGNSKKDFNISLYSSKLGVDLFWRETGDDYKLRNVNIGSQYDTSNLNGLAFNGLEATIKGFNIYYIVNNKRFSYPAAYSQSTVQRKSAGSWLFGLGYTVHTLRVDWDCFENIVDQVFNATDIVAPTLKISNVKYTDIALSAGYSYNWVFARNWLFNASLSTGLAYNHSTSDDTDSAKFYDHIKKLNYNGILRLGIVWNNTKWFAGASAIFHSYNYKQQQFYTNNTFGSINFYFGFNFLKRKN